MPAVNVYLDESSDEKREVVFAVGGIIVGPQDWAVVEKEWNVRLGDLEYYSTKDSRALSGPFRRLVCEYGLVEARARAGKVRASLEDLLLSIDSWGGFGVGIVIPDYTEAFSVTPSAGILFDRGDPTVTAYQQAIYEIARTVGAHVPGHEAGVTFIIDDSNYAQRIQAAHAAIAVHHPAVGRSLAVAPMPLSDKTTPGLQAADLVAGLVKDAFLRWIKAGRPSEGVDVGEQWIRHFVQPVGIWDRNHMLRTVRETITSKRFFSGELVRQPAKSLPSSERKRRQRVLLQKRNFNTMIKEILAE